MPTLRETYFLTVVHGSSFEEITTAARRAIREFFGRDVPFAIDIKPYREPDQFYGGAFVPLVGGMEPSNAVYEAEVRCRGFEV